MKAIMLSCLVATVSADFKRPCDGMSYAWCDHTKDMESRVDALIANLTLEEKSSLFVNGAGAVPRVNWPAYQWWYRSKRCLCLPCLVFFL